MLQKGDILICASSGSKHLVGKAAQVTFDGEYTFGAFCKVVRPKNINPAFLGFFFQSPNYRTRISNLAQGANINNIRNEHIDELEISTYESLIQDNIVQTLSIVAEIINRRKEQLRVLEELVKLRFVEMFGDLKTNSKGWRIAGFKECADIDTNMIHDFEGYEDYPHIGIDSIEKETGNLIGYRTIAEDGVVSGKYLFSPAHIIYSKIRPNLNKVAMPDFDGLCSADAYPILVKEGICNREFFGYTLRSQYFLDYILAFSNRTTLPRVNKNQVEGFTLPLPPIELQIEFATFVKQVDKLKFVVQKSIDETQLLFDSLMQKYFS
ncbi:MAG: restriction endonuclease subunit S [Thermoguttaceae bacterium]|nr:restriction endonuclease subunit S [Thermoguttaceae bacterium]